ncbi:single-strand DNA-binding protein [Williamsoniiplasma somnilux]|uniref:Single-strand DNA-binding protein n=1 Tax=Williamsoniiplasma somnilux TaxID=215578 RepID=A0A2K8NYB1_9MOLU|nr:single-stranded DNA-binding protein [Williamsoniiplasma somnilux]ATZ18822.1 single-strand DNA-binding protein [Williamsoniiplasma somnilux]
MNNVNIIGQIEGDATVAFASEDGAKKLYKFLLRVPRTYKKKNGELAEDLINIKCWSNSVDDEFSLHDQAFIGIEGRIQSFGNSEHSNYANEVLATKVVYLN